MPTMDLTVRALCGGVAVCARACGPRLTHRRWASCPPWTSRCVRFVWGVLSVRAPVARASYTGTGRHAHHGPHGVCALCGGCCLCARLWPVPHTQALGVVRFVGFSAVVGGQGRGCPPGFSASKGFLPLLLPNQRGRMHLGLGCMRVGGGMSAKACCRTWVQCLQWRLRKPMRP